MIHTIGFIGTGVMGSSMVMNLLRAGFEVTVYNRTKSKADACVAAGAVWADGIASCVRGKDAVITIVGMPKDVKSVYFGEKGVLENASRGAYLIDMTTSEPSLAAEISDAAAVKGLRALDAPVSGGDIGAREGKLTIMVGGDKSAYDACLPVFEALGSRIVLQGDAGAGQSTKLCNQIAIAGTLAAVCEALTFAENAGLDGKKVLESIGAGSAGSFQMANLAPKMLAGDYAPGFYMKHFVKDLRIARDEADELGVSLGVLETVLDMCESLLDEGKGESGTQALYEYYKM